MAMNLAQIANLSRPGLAAIFGDYMAYPSQWTEIFDVYHSDKADEYETEMKFLGLAQIRPEGAPTAVDSMGQRITTRYTHKTIALSFSMTQQAIEDDLYKTHFPMVAKSLKHSLHVSKDTLGASVLNNGFNAAYPIGDGQPLFSLNHPIDGGVVANTFGVSQDFNEASLESAIVQVQQFRDQAGLLCATKPLKLILPPQLQFVGRRILNSEFRVGTANNDINAIRNADMIPEGYRVNQYLTSPSAWFLLTDSPDSFKHYIRKPIELDMYADFSTDNLMAKAVERYSFGVSQFRGAFASGN